MSKWLRARTALTAGISGAILAAAMPASAVERTFDIDFNLTDVPIFDSDSSPVFEALLAEYPVGPNLSLGGVADVGIFGKFGAEATFRASVDIGLQTKVSDFQVGTTTVDLPIRVKLDTPTNIQPGQAFTIGSSFEILEGANFNARANQATVEIGASVGLTAELGVKACAFGCFIDEKFIDINEHLGVIPLIKQTVDSTEIQIDIPGYGKPTIAGSGIDIDPDNTDDDRSALDPDFLLDFALANASNIDGRINSPDFEVEGSLDGNILVGTKRDVFSDINVNLTGYIPGTTLFNIGPIEIGGGVQLGYDLFSGVLSTQLIGEQRIEFEAKPMITLDLGAELGIHTFAAGESLELIAPETLGDISFDPIISLDSMLTTQIALAATQDFTVTIGEIFLKFPDIVVLKGTDPVIVDPPRVCVIPWFTGCQKYVDPKPFTLIPGTDGIKFDGFEFNEHILKYSFKDDALTSGFGAAEAVCPPGESCEVPFGIGGVENSETYSSMQSFQAAGVSVGEIDIQVPAPPAFALLLVPGLLLAARRRR